MDKSVPTTIPICRNVFACLGLIRILQIPICSLLDVVTDGSWF